MKYSPETFARKIEDDIKKSLDQMGIMFRIFSRVKDSNSLDKKIKSDPKYGTTCKVQDLIGVRIVLYFADDVKVVHHVISKCYSERKKDASIDDLNAETFKPVRYNLVYDIPKSQNITLKSGLLDFVDLTFELQIRTVLSEGWHEVEHDFRYKYQDNWNDYPDESRKLNGVYASLETNEWTMVQIFEGISYGHYKSQQWEPMLRQKLRVRMPNVALKDEIVKLFNCDNELAKSFFRLDRATLISELHRQNFGYPLRINNIIMFANIVFIRNDAIFDITPEEFIEEYEPYVAGELGAD